MKIGFDNDKYLKIQSEHIRERIAQFDGKLYMELGGKLIKNNAGYNLCQLILGSEGTLAIVTKVILKIYPKDNYSATIVAPFERFQDACDAVTDILKSGTLPLAVEYMDKRLFTGTAEMQIV